MVLTCMISTAGIHGNTNWEETKMADLNGDQEQEPEKASEVAIGEQVK